MPPPLRDTISRPGAEIYIGSSEFQHDHIARIRPLALAGEDGWRALPPELFCEGELVFSLDPVVVRRENGHVVTFTMERTNPGSRDPYLTTEVCEPYQVIELGSTSSENQRLASTQTGFVRSSSCFNQFIILLGNGRCVIPTMEFDREQHRWIVANSENLSALDVFETDLEQHGRLFGIEEQRFALPGHRPHDVVGVVNWEAESDCLAAVLKFLKKNASTLPGTEFASLTLRTIEGLQAAVARGDLLKTDRREILALHERLPAILAKLQAGAAAVEALANEILMSGAVAKRVDELVDAQKEARLIQLEESIRLETRTRVESEFRELTQRNACVRSEIDEATAREEALRADVQRLIELRQERLEQVRAFLSVLRDRIVDGSREFATLVDVAREIGFEFPSSAMEAARSTLALPTPWSTRATGDATTARADELPSILKAAASATGVPISAFAALDASLRAGLLVTLVGPDADHLLDVYAACVTGGEVHRLALDPTVLGPDDVWRHPATGRETAFAEAWRVAEREDGRAVLACLDNSDAASLADWLTAFDAVYRRVRPPNLLTVLMRRNGINNSAGRTAERRGVEIVAGPYPDAGAAVIHRGGTDRLPRRVLITPLLSTLDVDDREDVSAAAQGMKEFGAEAAGKLAALYAAVKPWLSIDLKLKELPRALLSEGRAANGGERA